MTNVIKEMLDKAVLILIIMELKSYEGRTTVERKMSNGKRKPYRLVSGLRRVLC